MTDDHDPDNRTDIRRLCCELELALRREACGWDGAERGALIRAANGISFAIAHFANHAAFVEQAIEHGTAILSTYQVQRLQTWLDINDILHAKSDRPPYPPEPRNPLSA